MHDHDTEGLDIVIDDLDHAEQAVGPDANTRRIVKQLIGEVRRWRSLGKDLVHGASLAARAKEVEQLKADYAAAVSRAIALEEQAPSEAVLLENQFLRDELIRIKARDKAQDADAAYRLAIGMADSFEEHNIRPNGDEAIAFTLAREVRRLREELSDLKGANGCLSTK